MNKQNINKSTKLEFMDNVDEGKNQVLTNKQRKNLEEIANKYYQQASELTFDNLLLNQKVQQLTEERAVLLTKLAFYQRENGEKIQQEPNQLLNKIQKQENDLFIPKRNRRISNQVKKKFVCPIQKCNKLYGTYAALYLHFKNKHPDRSMKLIAHSSTTIKVSGEDEQDSFLKQLRMMEQKKERKKNQDSDISN